MNGDLLIFDLDGTLIDSKRDLTDSVNATRAWKGLAPLPDDIVSAYVGDGAPMLIRRALPHSTDEELDQAHQFFLQYYREHMLDATTLYPGVREALDQLHAARVPLAILTNKPVRFSVRLIEGLKLGGHFFRIYGGNSPFYFGEESGINKELGFGMKIDGSPGSRVNLQDDAEAGFAAHHSLIGFLSFFEWVDLVHRGDVVAQTEAQRIFRIRGSS